MKLVCLPSKLRLSDSGAQPCIPVQLQVPALLPLQSILHMTYTFCCYTEPLHSQYTPQPSVAGKAISTGLCCVCCRYVLATRDVGTGDVRQLMAEHIIICHGILGRQYLPQVS